MEKTKKILELIGYKDFEVNFDEANRRVSVIIPEFTDNKKDVPVLLSSFERILNLIFKKEGQEAVMVDINNYRRERERLIVELAKAAARKAILEKNTIELPPMNAYERRLVHVEIASRPDLKTESVGDGSERRVVVKPIE